MATLGWFVLLIPLFWLGVYVMFILDSWIPETIQEFKTKWDAYTK